MVFYINYDKLEKEKTSIILYEIFCPFQVRVGGPLSKIVPMENGSPQGSVISPLLFLIIMNDYPLDVHCGSRLALFADDSFVYKFGSSHKYITNSIQIYLNNIYEWCNQWGFKISDSKTICVLFTRPHNFSPIPMPLSLRRENLSLKYANKIIIAKNYPTTSILQETWPSHVKKKSIARETFYQRIILTLIALDISIVHNLNTKTGWNIIPCDYDLSLSNLIFKKTHSQAIQYALAIALVNQYSHFVRIYTDSSSSAGV